MQKLVSDVLVEQKPAMAQEFRKLLAWKGRVAALEDEKRKLTEQLARYEADVKVQTARQLKDEVRLLPPSPPPFHARRRLPCMPASTATRRACHPPSAAVT